MVELSVLKTQEDIALSVRDAVKKRRKELKITQAEIAKKSGVSLGSYKRFEQSGEISFRSLIDIAFVLDCQNDFLNLFSQKKYNSIQDVINERKK